MDLGHEDRWDKGIFTQDNNRFVLFCFFFKVVSIRTVSFLSSLTQV